MKKNLVTLFWLLCATVCVASEASIDTFAQGAVNKASGDGVNQTLNDSIGIDRFSGQSQTAAVAVSPLISKSVSSLSGFNYYVGNGPSSQQSFTISGTGLNAGITIAAPANYEISALPGILFFGQSTLTIGRVNGTVSPITLYVRLKSGLSAGAYQGDISLSSTGATTQLIALNGTVAVTPPSVTLSANSLSGFSYVVNAGPSAQTSFTFSGHNLTSAVTITAPVNYEISVLSGVGFVGTNSISIPPVGGTISTTPIYVRLKAGLAVGAYNSSVAISSDGITKSLSLTGSVIDAPFLGAGVDELIDLDYYVGTGPSKIQSFSVFAYGLNSYLILTAPQNFEISTDQDSLFNGAQQMLLIPDNGTIDTTDVFVRLIGGLPIGKYTGTLIISSNGMTSDSINLTGVVRISTDSPENKEILQLYSHAGRVTIDGLTPGTELSIYNTIGTLVKRSRTSEQRYSVELPTGQVYIVRAGGQSLKIAL